ncbi:MAG: PAS domain-containing protein [Desulfobacterium sp.]|nr:PAS domain-containing protein [Desulfobacterium sp.]
MERNECFYQLLTEHSIDMVTLHSSDGVCMYVSPASLDLMGYAPEELVGRVPHEFYHSGDFENKQKGFEIKPDKETFHTHPYRIRHKKGHYVWVETTGKQVIHSSAGDVGSIVATTRDLGCRKASGKQPLASEKKHRSLDAYETAVKSTLDLAGVVDREAIDPVLPHALRSYRGVKGDEIIGCKVCEVLSEKKRICNELRNKAEQFRLIAETIQEVFWVSTPGLQELLYVSPAYEILWGRSREGLYEDPHSFLDAILPCDRKKFCNFEVLHAQGQWDYEYRIVRPDKSIIWIKDRGYPVTDDAGNIKVMVGVAADITELKQIQEALKKGNRNLDRTVKSRTAELEIANRELKEKTDTLRELNMALRIVIDNKDEAREDLKEHVISHLKTHIVPYLEKLKSTALDPLQDTYVKVIEFNIEQAFDPLVSKLNSRYFNLSPAEIKIANLIKIGKTSKEIACLTNISKGTVDWHRIQIRKKMGLQNKKISLRNKLRSIK